MQQNTLYQLGNIPFPLSALSDIYTSTKYISDKARRLEQNGLILRLKKGLYIRNDKEESQPISELIANHIYGPSYVSMLSALRHYGLIPEHVYATQSMTIKHSRSFETPLGRFDYFSCSKEYFPIGINQHKENGLQYLIARPEKALCDLLVKTHGLFFDTQDSMTEYLDKDLRFDIETLKSFDIEIIHQCYDKTITREKNIEILIFMLLR